MAKVSENTGGVRLLDGVRVLDFTSGLTGPYVTRLMADMGSEIIKVEKPLTGDYSRHLPYILSETQSGYFIQQNCGKESISIDLNRPEGIEIIRKLSAKTDVILEDFPIGFMERSGIGHPDLVKLNPRLIMCSLSACGRTGPYTGQTGTGRVLASLCGARDPSGMSAPPTGLRVAVPDLNAGAHALVAIIASLYYCRKNGAGQHIDISVLDCLFSTLHPVQAHLMGEVRDGPSSSQVFRTGDGKLIIMNAWTQNNFWARLAELMDRPELIKDKRFDTAPHRAGNREALDSSIAEWVRHHTAQEVLDPLQEAGVPAVIVKSVAEAINDPQINARKLMTEITVPELGNIRVMNSPFKLTETAAGLRGLPPAIGQHNRGVLNRLLGYTASEVAALEASGIMYAEAQAAGQFNRQRSQATEPAGKDASIGEKTGFTGGTGGGFSVKPGVFEKLRVLDFSRALAGPFMTRLMADMGAEVLKVEEPVTGDPARHVGYIASRNNSSFFTLANCGKKSISINLRHAEGLKIVKQLVEISDVVVENFRPGVMDKLGIGYKDLKQINPRIVMCSISGFGQWGPYAALRGEAATITAMSGAQDPAGSAVPPEGYRHAWADQLAGLLSLAAVGAALYRRQVSHTGEYVDMAMLDCLFTANDTDVQSYILSGGKVRPVPLENHHRTMVPAGDFRTGNGQFVYIEAYEDETWKRLAGIMDNPELAGDRRFNKLSYRVKNRETLYPLIEDWFCKFDNVGQVLKKLKKAGVPSAPVQTIKEAVKDPHLIARNMITDLVHPDIGKIRVINSPLKFSLTEAHPAGPPPGIGQHSRDILTGLLGYDSKQLHNLESSGVIFTENDSGK